MIRTELQKILDFWFIDLKPHQWFAKDKNLDKQIQERFLSTHEKYKDCVQHSFNLDETLALILLFDQFSRNMFRGEKKSFQFDPIALKMTKKGIENQFHDLLKKEKEKQFFLMPLMHSENLEDQKLSVQLFKLFEKTAYQFAVSHYKIIQRFGRFPHRNQLLKRQSTAEEISFLQTPNSSF